MARGCTIGGIVAIAALRSIGIVIVALCARSRNRTACHPDGVRPADAGLPLARLPHAGGNHPDEACAGRASGRTWMLQDVPVRAAGFAADAAGAAGVARARGKNGAAGFGRDRRLLGLDALPCALEAKAFLGYGQPGSTVRRCGLHHSPIASSFVQNSLAVNAKFLASSYTRAFGTQFLLSWAARMPSARPLLIHGELVPSHRATMFVIPRLFPGHDGTYPHALDYRVQHTQARGLNAHGLTAAESVGYSAVSPLVEACASAIFLACASADSMPIFHPVSLAAKRAFWPSLPMASDS